MSPELVREIAGLARLPTKSLRERYAAAFGESTASGNRAWLMKRIAWRLQANAEGDLSERSRQRARELANDADLRVIAPSDAVKPPKEAKPIVAPTRQSDHRLPPPGTILTRNYRGSEIRLTILANGFEHDGTLYPSLSAAAKAISGSHCNGYSFFRLTQESKR